MLDDIDLATYDLISLHFGNLEIEQLLPTLWTGRRRPPVVYHVHCLDWTLFTRHVPDPVLRDNVKQAVSTMDGYVFFGVYAQTRLGVAAPFAVAWLPTTIPPDQQASMTPRLQAALMSGQRMPVGTLYGYAAPWKDATALVAACERASAAARLVIAGPFWDDPAQVGADLTREAASAVRHGPIEVAVVADYFDAGDRRALAAVSDFAVFPYRPQPTFQGSGAIADYLSYGIPVLVTDVANMAELVGDAGLVVPHGDADALAGALDRLAGEHTLRARLGKAARRRAHRFTAAHHARTCLRLYEQVTAIDAARR